MGKVITITVSDEKYKEHYVEVGEIVGIAAYLEARVTILDTSYFAPGGYNGSRLTEPA